MGTEHDDADDSENPSEGLDVAGALRAQYDEARAIHMYGKSVLEILDVPATPEELAERTAAAAVTGYVPTTDDFQAMRDVLVFVLSVELLGTDGFYGRLRDAARVLRGEAEITRKDTTHRVRRAYAEVLVVARYGDAWSARMGRSAWDERLLSILASCDPAFARLSVEDLQKHLATWTEQRSGDKRVTVKRLLFDIGYACGAFGWADAPRSTSYDRMKATLLGLSDSMSDEDLEVARGRVPAGDVDFYREHVAPGFKPAQVASLPPGADDETEPRDE